MTPKTPKCCRLGLWSKQCTVQMELQGAGCQQSVAPCGRSLTLRGLYEFFWGGFWYCGLFSSTNDSDLGIYDSRWLWFLKESRQVLRGARDATWKAKEGSWGFLFLPLPTVPKCWVRAEKESGEEREGQSQLAFNSCVAWDIPYPLSVLTSSSVKWFYKVLSGLEVLCQKYLSQADARKWELIL